LPSPIHFSASTMAVQVPVDAAEIAALWRSAGSDFKFLLDRENVETAIQSQFFAAGILTVKLFSTIADDKAELRQIMKDSFGLDSTANITARIKVCKVIVAWTSARARAAKSADAEGEAEAKNIPKDLSTGDYHSMRACFEGRFWELSDRELPGRTYIEKKLDEIEKGDVRPEMLSEVVSREEDEPDSMKVNFGLGGELKAVKVSSKVPLPSDTESLRHRIILLGTAWQFISFHQTNRSSLVGLSPQLFQQYLAYLLGEHVLGLLLRDGRGLDIQTPAWHLLVTYEFSVRKKAMDLMRRGTPFCNALRQAWECPMTKERYFSTPLAMDTVSRRPFQQQPRPQNGISEPFLKKAKVEAEVPTRRRTGEKPQGKHTPGKKTAKMEASASRHPAYKGALENSEGKPMCFRFNLGTCKNPKCLYQHACGGCFKQNVAMKDCPTCKNKGSH
jgi:hypothetical protein